MPGSLFLGTDNYSEYSGRSLDSKLGGKKVSFNKAVKVKQYPWNVATSEHLTLPSSKFWFKVYKKENDVSNSTPKENSWDEESVECIHDSLAPIAEVDDQNIETSPKLPIERNRYKQNFKSQPTDPPVDYFNNRHLTSNIIGARRVWEENVYDTSNTQWKENENRNNTVRETRIFRGHQIPLNEDDYKIDEKSFSTSMHDNTMLPHSNFRNEFTKRRSMRRLDSIEKHERRSRSHDDYVDNDNYLKKADKAVSTEDLNIGNGHISSSNRFFKRDIATQCYGTLTRNQSSFKNQNTSAFSQTISNTERLKNFKPQRPGLNLANDTNAIVTSPKKDYSLEKVSGVIRTRTNSPKLFQISNQTGQNYKHCGQKLNFSNKASNDNLKPIGRTEKSISNIIQKQTNESFNRYNSKSEQNSLDIKNDRENAIQYLTSREPYNKVSNQFHSMDNKNNIARYVTSKEPNDTLYNPRNGLNLLDTKNNRENGNNTVRETSILRGHQIPLSEVNTNTNRKFISRSNSILNENCISRKTDENHIMVKGSTIKPNVQLVKGHQIKRYPPNNYERRSFRNTSNSAKSYTSEGSMIDWSLSGFQLASKPENSLNSVSDSEYTVYRRPPLLMYIPGVGHQDRPAIEDDRLSALSDLSRSELSSTKGSVIGDFRRRQLMKKGKSNWLKSRSKS